MEKHKWSNPAKIEIFEKLKSHFFKKTFYELHTGNNLNSI
jgi:hypothetical protein